jgi:hypothetical protein
MQLRPRRTHHSNQVFRLPGGNEDNDLWVENNGEQLISVYVPTEEQRQAIADGGNILVCLWGQAHPPIALLVDDERQIGKPPAEEGERG